MINSIRYAIKNFIGNLFTARHGVLYDEMNLEDQKFYTGTGKPYEFFREYQKSKEDYINQQFEQAQSFRRKPEKAPVDQLIDEVNEYTYANHGSSILTPSSAKMFEVDIINALKENENGKKRNKKKSLGKKKGRSKNTKKQSRRKA